MSPSTGMKEFLFRQCRITILLAIILQTAASNADAQEANNGQLRMSTREIMTAKATGRAAPGSSNYSAVQEIVIFGDPATPTLYTILLKIAPNTKIAAHLHPDQRMGTVISGTWYFGYGDKFDESKLKQLPAGSVYSEVMGQNHFAMTGSEPVIVAITGFGPSGVTYADPAKDPSNKK